MKTFTHYKSAIKAAKNADDIRKIYCVAMEIAENKKLFNKIIEACVQREQQIGA